MNKKAKTVLPKYRFPDFLQSEEWRVKNLGNATYVVSRKNTKGVKYPIYSINNKEGFLPQTEQFEGVDSNSRGYDISLYKIVGKNTFAYNPARINVGSIGYSGELCDIIISSLYVCFKTNEKFDDKFFQHFLSTSTFNSQVENKAEGGIRSYLFYENFSKIMAAFPDIREQQKIADCLTSLDELIAAENKKLDALKTHKKGLMQKLFPAEGKTVPVIRLKGFSNTWEQRKLGEVVRFVGGATPFKGNPDYWNGSIVWLSSQEIKDRFVCTGTYKITEKAIQDNTTKMVKAGTPLIVTRSGILAKRFPISIPTIDVAINQDIKALLYDDNVIDTGFIVSILQKNEDTILKSIVKGGTTVQSVSIPDFQKLVMSFPDLPEQAAIGNLFRNLDDLIYAQTEKIDTLKQHKKGLMQGLFPYAREVIE